MPVDELVLKAQMQQTISSLLARGYFDDEDIAKAANGKFLTSEISDYIRLRYLEHYRLVYVEKVVDIYSGYDDRLSAITIHNLKSPLKLTGYRDLYEFISGELKQLKNNPATVHDLTIQSYSVEAIHNSLDLIGKEISRKGTGSIEQNRKINALATLHSIASGAVFADQKTKLAYDATWIDSRFEFVPQLVHTSIFGKILYKQKLEKLALDVKRRGNVSIKLAVEIVKRHVRNLDSECMLEKESPSTVNDYRRSYLVGLFEYVKKITGRALEIAIKIAATVLILFLTIVFIVSMLEKDPVKAPPTDKSDNKVRVQEPVGRGQGLQDFVLQNCKDFLCVLPDGLTYECSENILDGELRLTCHVQEDFGKFVHCKQVITEALVSVDCGV